MQKDTDIIEVETKGKRSTLPFDVLVLCTGFTYTTPIKNDGTYTIAGRQNNLANFSKQVDDAKNIAVIGAGIVAVELAGEISFHKKIAEK